MPAAYRAATRSGGIFVGDELLGAKCSGLVVRMTEHARLDSGAPRLNTHLTLPMKAGVGTARMCQQDALRGRGRRLPAGAGCRVYGPGAAATLTPAENIESCSSSIDIMVSGGTSNGTLTSIALPGLMSSTRP